MAPLDAGETMSAVVVLAKPDAKWAVASSRNGRLLLLQVGARDADRLPCTWQGPLALVVGSSIVTVTIIFTVVSISRYF